LLSPNAIVPRPSPSPISTLADAIAADAIHRLSIASLSIDRTSGDDVYCQQETAAAAAVAAVAFDKLEGPRPPTRDYGDETQQRQTAVTSWHPCQNFPADKCARWRRARRSIRFVLSLLEGVLRIMMLAERYVLLNHIAVSRSSCMCARALFTYCKYVLFCIHDTESTDRVFLRYRYGNYREILTDTDSTLLQLMEF
jgi:hypothetical protein